MLRSSLGRVPLAGLRRESEVQAGIGAWRRTSGFPIPNKALSHTQGFQRGGWRLRAISAPSRYATRPKQDERHGEPATAAEQCTYYRVAAANTGCHLRGPRARLRASFSRATLGRQSHLRVSVAPIDPVPKADALPISATGRTTPNSWPAELAWSDPTPQLVRHPATTHCIAVLASGEPSRGNKSLCGRWWRATSRAARLVVEVLPNNHHVLLVQYG